MQSLKEVVNMRIKKEHAFSGIFVLLMQKLSTLNFFRNIIFYVSYNRIILFCPTEGKSAVTAEKLKKLKHLGSHKKILIKNSMYSNEK